MPPMSIDPVCGMTVDDEKGVSTKFHGREYFFCSEDCRERFESEPRRYVEQAA